MFLSIIFGSAPLEASSEQDEKANFGKLQITFPLTKAENRTIKISSVLDLYWYQSVDLPDLRTGECIFLAPGHTEGGPDGNGG